MPIIFPFTQTGAILAVILFFVSLLYCGFTALYLESRKGERLLVWRISLIVGFLICLYFEYSAATIGMTLNPPEKTNIECKG